MFMECVQCHHGNTLYYAVTVLLHICRHNAELMMKTISASLGASFSLSEYRGTFVSTMIRCHETSHTIQSPIRAEKCAAKKRCKSP
jgi:hypothetical protein